MTGTPDYLAERANYLLNDDILAAAFERVRLDALAKLAVVDASNTVEILRLQAMANCLTDVRDALIAVILASGKSDGGVSP